MKNLILFLACIIYLIGGFSGAQGQSHPCQLVVKPFLSHSPINSSVPRFPHPKPDSACFEKFFYTPSRSYTKQKFGFKYNRDSWQQVISFRISEIDSNSNSTPVGEGLAEHTPTRKLKEIKFYNLRGGRTLMYDFKQNRNSQGLLTSIQLLDSNLNLIQGDSLVFDSTGTRCDSITYYHCLPSDSGVWKLWERYYLYSNLVSGIVDSIVKTRVDFTTNIGQHWQTVFYIHSEIEWSPLYTNLDEFILFTRFFKSSEHMLEHSFWTHPRPCIIEPQILDNLMMKSGKHKLINPLGVMSGSWVYTYQNSLPIQLNTINSGSLNYSQSNFQWFLEENPRLKKITAFASNGANNPIDFLYNSFGHLEEEVVSFGGLSNRLDGRRYFYTYPQNSNLVSGWTEMKDWWIWPWNDTVVKVNLFFPIQANLIENKIQDIGIFPNPCSDWFQISGLNSEGGKLQILDLKGSTIISYDLNSEIVKISTENWIPGLYLGLLQLQNGENKVIKIIKR